MKNKIKSGFLREYCKEKMKEQKFEIVVEDIEELKALHKRVVDDSVAGMLGGGTPSKRDMFLMNILNQFVAQISE